MEPEPISSTNIGQQGNSSTTVAKPLASTVWNTKLSKKLSGKEYELSSLEPGRYREIREDGVQKFIEKFGPNAQNADRQFPFVLHEFEKGKFRLIEGNHRAKALQQL